MQYKVVFNVTGWGGLTCASRNGFGTGFGPASTPLGDGFGDGFGFGWIWLGA